MLKSILRSAPVVGMLAALVAAYMAIVKRTTRWTVEGREHVQPFWDDDSGLILCVWHGRFLICNSGWPRRKKRPSVLISQSSDGDFITATTKRLGLGVIRGSTNRAGSGKERGGGKALREMVRHLRGDGVMVITPDGPRGPRMHCGGGAVTLAKMTGKPALPYALATKNRKVFKSWDRFMFPFPFGRGAIIYGEPVTVDRRADPEALEAARQLLERRMITANQRADAIIGKDIIQPSDTAKVARNDA